MKILKRNGVVCLLVVTLLIANFSLLWADELSMDKAQQPYGDDVHFEVFLGRLFVKASYPQTHYVVLDNAISQWLRDLIARHQMADSGAGTLTVDYDAKLIAEKFIALKLFAEYKDETGETTNGQVAFNMFVEKEKMLCLNDIFSDEQMVELKSKVALASGIEARYFDTNPLDNWNFDETGLIVDLLAEDYSPLLTEDFQFFLPYGALLDMPSLIDRLSQHPSTYAATSDIVNLKSDKKIALTFDDGPGPYTERLLNILQKHGARATFFVVGQRVAGRKETVARMANEYHEVANHTWNHPALTRISNARVESQLKSTSDAIQAVIGSGGAMTRAPYGALNNRVKALAYQLGYYFISWSIDPKDWQTRNANKTYNRVMNHVGDGQIILLHDIHYQSVDAAERLIPKLIEMGYELVTVSELLKDGGIVPQGGQVYRKRP